MKENAKTIESKVEVQYVTLPDLDAVLSRRAADGVITTAAAVAIIDDVHEHVGMLLRKGAERAEAQRLREACYAEVRGMRELSKDVHARALLDAAHALEAAKEEARRLEGKQRRELFAMHGNDVMRLKEEIQKITERMAAVERDTHEALSMSAERAHMHLMLDRLRRGHRERLATAMAMRMATTDSAARSYRDAIKQANEAAVSSKRRCESLHRIIREAAPADLPELLEDLKAIRRRMEEKGGEA